MSTCLLLGPVGEDAGATMFGCTVGALKCWETSDF